MQVKRLIDILSRVSPELNLEVCTYAQETQEFTTDKLGCVVEEEGVITLTSAYVKDMYDDGNFWVEGEIIGR